MQDFATELRVPDPGVRALFTRSAAGSRGSMSKPPSLPPRLTSA